LSLPGVEVEVEVEVEVLMLALLTLPQPSHLLTRRLPEMWLAW